MRKCGAAYSFRFTIGFRERTLKKVAKRLGVSEREAIELCVGFVNDLQNSGQPIEIKPPQITIAKSG